MEPGDQRRGVVAAIVGPRSDDEVLALGRALRARHARVRVIDTTGLPGAHGLEIRDLTVVYDGRELSGIDVVYIRRLRFLVDDTFLVAEAGSGRLEAALERWIAERQGERELGGLIWAALALLDAPLVNSLEGQLVHSRKAAQLRSLIEAGVPVPPFVATNDLEVASRFVEAHGADGVVVKPVRGILKTRLLAPGERLPLERRPVLLQRYVRGSTLRVYVVGGEVIAAGVMRNAGAVDSSVEPRGVELADLDEQERRIARLAAKVADLPFTGLDIQRPADGSPSMVLECNAAPMFANFARRTGADVPGALAAYLIGRARGGATWEGESAPDRGHPTRRRLP
jgi:glutathione synthase/RimK-type ligase-like ATP-grasp enzyme